MNKRLLLCYILCVLLLLSLVACSCTRLSASELVNGVFGTIGKQDPIPIAPEKEDVISETAAKQDSEPIGVPPQEIEFVSISDIKAFFSGEGRDRVNSPVETLDYKYMYEEIQNEAMKFSEVANTVYYPVADIDGGFSFRSSGPNGPYLDLIYIVDGIQYSFTYFYDCHTPVVYENELAFSGVEVGPYVFDLYRMDHPLAGETYLLGSIMVNGFVVTVRIQGENNEKNFDFSVFDYIMLSSAVDNVVS